MDSTNRNKFVRPVGHIVSNVMKRDVSLVRNLSNPMPKGNVPVKRVALLTEIPVHHVLAIVQYVPMQLNVKHARIHSSRMITNNATVIRVTSKMAIIALVVLISVLCAKMHLNVSNVSHLL